MERWQLLSLLAGSLFVAVVLFKFNDFKMCNNHHSVCVVFPKRTFDIFYFVYQEWCGGGRMDHDNKMEIGEPIFHH